MACRCTVRVVAGSDLTHCCVSCLASHRQFRVEENSSRKVGWLRSSECGWLNSSLFVDPAEAVLNKSSADELSDRNGRAAKKIYELFSGYSEDKKPHKARQFPWTKPYIKPKKCHIQFLRSPVELKGQGKLETVVFEKNALSGEPFKQSARGTGELEKLEAGILFRSIGYRGVALDGVPFHDAWGVIPNDKGRITEDNENNVVVPQMYTAGWIKRGPSGIIGTNKACANETIAELMQDITKLDDKKERLGNKKSMKFSTQKK